MPLQTCFHSRRTKHLTATLTILLRTATLGLLLSSCKLTDGLMAHPEPGSYQHAQQVLANALQQSDNTRQAKGIILFIGDGMSLATVTAGRIYTGQQLGKTGEEHVLSFETFPHTGLAKTYNTNQQTPDSAGTMTAMITGTKTRAGMLSIAPQVQRGSTDSCNSGQLKTLIEIAEQAGWATGIVTTTTITHATPAAGYAHSPERGWESDGKMPEAALNKGCKDIAQQLIDFNDGDGIDVVMGGGFQHFVSKPEGARNDNRHLVQEWKNKYPAGKVVRNQQELAAIDATHTEKLLGLFAREHMDFEYDRPLTDQPSFSTMVTTALTLLGRHDNFLLIAESGRIDHAHHYGNAFRALNELREMDNAVKQALQHINPDNTLVVVTADHSHTLTLAGYPVRGNPILDFVITNDRSGEAEKEYLRAADGQPFTTLGYANGFGHCDSYSNVPVKGYAPCIEAIKQPHTVDETDHPTHANFQQKAGVPLFMETHGADDVPIYAQGPWAHLLDGVIEQNVIFHVMKHAAGL